MTVLTRPTIAALAVNGHQRLTLQAFLALPEGPPYYEFDEGVLVSMPRPHERHQAVLMALSAALWPYITTRKLGRVWPEIEVILSGETHAYVPDLVYLKPEHLAYCSEATGRIHGTPDLVVEILSPSTRKRDRTTKMKAYQAADVPWYWLVEQDDLTIEELELTNRGYLMAQTITAGQTFTPALFPDLTIDLAALMGETITPEEDNDDAI